MCRFFNKAINYKFNKLMYKKNLNDINLKMQINVKYCLKNFKLKKFCYYVKNDYLICLLLIKRNFFKYKRFFFYKFYSCRFINFNIIKFYKSNLFFFHKYSISFNKNKKSIFLKKWFLYKLIKKNWEYLLFLYNYFNKYVFYAFDVNFKNLFTNFVIKCHKIVSKVQKYNEILNSENKFKINKIASYISYNCSIEGNIFIHFNLSLNLCSLLKNCINFLYFSKFIINNTFLLKNLFNFILKNSSIKLLFQNSILRSFCKIVKIAEVANFKIELRNFPKKKLKCSLTNSEILYILIEWTKNLHYYINFLKFRFIKKNNIFLILHFFKKKKLNNSNRKKQKTSKILKFNIRNIKSILYKNRCIVIIWIRLISELFFLNNINYMLEIVFFLIKKNGIFFNSNLTKKIFIILEIIAGNNNFRNFYHKKSDQIKEFFCFINIHSNKTPGKTEKLISNMLSTKVLNIAKFKTFNFFFRYGLVDLYRKIIQKTILFSDGILHLKILKYWLNNEIYWNSNKVMRIIFISFVKRKIKIKNENLCLIVKNLYLQNWEYYIEYLKIFLETYGDLNLLKKNFKNLVSNKLNGFKY
jgi:hypothetical protein